MKMRVPVCLLVLTFVALGQTQLEAQGPSQTEPTPASGTGSPGALPDTNPWHELLHRMMELMQAAAGVGPAPGPSHSTASDTSANQNQGHAQQPQNQQSKQGQGQGQGQNQGRQQNPVQNKRPPTTPPPPPPKPTTPPKPLIQDCFWEGKYYRPGTDIVRGQHDRWCYVTYCDSQGNIQFWDDYNCPPNSMKPTSGHSAGRPGGGPPTPQPPTSAPSTGCMYESMYYDPGQEITSHHVGERCYGTYCSHDSQLIQWEDWCAAPTSPTPPPADVHPPILGTNQVPPQGGQAGSQGPSSHNQGQGQGQSQSQSQSQAIGQQGAVGQGGRSSGPPKGQSRGQQGGGRKAAPTKSGPKPAAAAQPSPGRRRGQSVQGCYHNNLYYQPNEDVIVGNIGDLCYGYYCEGDNVFVHWEDRCAHQPAAAPAPTSPPNSGFGGSAGFFFK